jgi:hypothetical protein
MLRIVNAKATGAAAPLWDDFDYPSHVKGDADVLAYFLCNVHHVKDDRDAGPMWQDLLMGPEKDVYPPSNTHIAEARMIRNYYKNKLLVQRLKGNEVSKFRKDLYTFANEHVTEVPIDFFGMMVRLPDFYEYDRTIDMIAEQYPAERELGSIPSQIIFDPATDILKHIATTKRYTKDTKRYEYWFSTKDRSVAKIDIELYNPLRKLFERHIAANNNRIQVTGYYNTQKLKGREDFNYYDISNWEIN